MNIGQILKDWNYAKKKADEIEEEISKYKKLIAKEMNSREVNKLTEDCFTVSRRRISKSYLTKDSVPVDIWNKYATKCAFDAYFLTKEKEVKKQVKKEKKRSRSR
jgi:hypothetical protein